MAKLTKTFTTTVTQLKKLMVDSLRKGYAINVYLSEGYISVAIHRGIPSDENYQSKSFSYYEYTSLPDPIDKREKCSKQFISEIKDYIEN